MEKRALSETKRGPSSLRRGPPGRWKPEKLEGDGFEKNVFLASSRTVRGARPDRPWLPLSDIWQRIKCYIAVTADRCDFSHWCAGPDRPDQRRGPSAVGRKGATTRKWLVAINTTPTTSIHNIQALQSFIFNTRASNPFQDTIKASNLSKFHNWDKWSLVISDLREREWSVCYLSLLSLGFCNRAFFLPILILKWLVVGDHN
jgi:hypothetical protein